MSRVEKFAHIAEVVAAIAVVVSLIYVGFEIRQNTVAVQISTHQSSIAMGQDWDNWFQDPGFASLYDLASRDYPSLSEPQKLQLSAFLGQGFNIWEFVFYAYDSGSITDELWEGWDRYFRSELDHGGPWRIHWVNNRAGYGGEFQCYVDEIIVGE